MSTLPRNIQGVPVAITSRSTASATLALAVALTGQGCGDPAEVVHNEDLGASRAGSADTDDALRSDDGVDKASCADANASCATWAARGECAKNPGYMLTSCCASCQKLAGNDQCPNDPNKTAPGACGCGVREPVDVAGYRDAQGYACADWKGYDCTRAAEQYGYTNAQETSIVTSCALSCGVCPSSGGGDPGGGTTGGTPGGGTTSPYNVYFGYLHSHTERSDGTGSPAQAYAAAKAAGLDFFAVTDHDYYPDNMTSTDWSTIRSAAAKYDNDAQFVAFWGFEWTSDSTEWMTNGKGLGHVTVINSETWCNAAKSGTDTLNGLVSWLNNQPNTFAWLNHPGQYGTTFDRFNFNKTDKIVGMELWNRSSDYYSNDGFYSSDGNKGYYDEALARGFYLGAGGGQDNHQGGWGTDSDSRIAVLATTKTRSALLSAFQARRFYSTRDKNLALSFECNGQPMGSKISTTSAVCSAKVSDGNGEVTSRIDLVKVTSSTSAAPTVTSRSTSTSSAQVSFPAASVKTGDVLYVRVYQAGSNGWQAISSPVFVK